MLSGDKLVEGSADLGRRHGDARAGAVVAEQDETELAADGLLVALHRLPRALPDDADGLRAQHLVDDGRLAPREAERREQAERDGTAVGDALVVGRRLEGVRER